ncbi:hypothetical protein GMO_09180 [Gluconobacter morbifer G707]|uniref:Uncharacterized protein n=1 Tax=Gluconobacter morbifer G707 TaxID=1088869 RepID=G6XHF2_9PROT|nr:hypothetical protein GMO_09180 [Gluconobacter morbifer G707]
MHCIIAGQDRGLRIVNDGRYSGSWRTDANLPLSVGTMVYISGE